MPTWIRDLPVPFRLAIAGLTAETLLIVLAVALRTTPIEAFEERGPTAAASGSAAASAGPSARAAGAGTSSAAPAHSAGAAPSLSNDAREVRAEFIKDVDGGRFKTAVTRLARLLELAPRAAEDGEVRGAIVELSMRVMLIEGSNEPEQTFDMISTKMGTTGGDILYELLTTRGGSRAAKRAEDLLKDEAVRARGTPAMRIAYDLRVTSGCEGKIALFERAKTDGDGRTLGQLQLLNRTCSRRSGTCCLHNDPKLREAIDGLKARLN